MWAIIYLSESNIYIAMSIMYICTEWIGCHASKFNDKRIVGKMLLLCSIIVNKPCIMTFTFCLTHIYMHGVPRSPWEKRCHKQDQRKSQGFV